MPGKEIAGLKDASVAIRKADAGDVKEISDLENISFSNPWSFKSLKEEIENPAAVFLVASDAGAVLGYIGACFIPFSGFDIVKVAVRPGFRRKGIAGLLLQNFMERAFEFANDIEMKSHGDVSPKDAKPCGFSEKAFEFTLEVRPSNTAALHLYEKFGFHEIWRRKRYYTDGEDALIMRKEREM